VHSGEHAVPERVHRKVREALLGGAPAKKSTSQPLSQRGHYHTTKQRIGQLRVLLHRTQAEEHVIQVGLRVTQ
jgi:hypothetical protein